MIDSKKQVLQVILNTLMQDGSRLSVVDAELCIRLVTELAREKSRPLPKPEPEPESESDGDDQKES